MTCSLIDGRALAQSMHMDLKTRISALPHAPKLAIILANDVEASKIYVNRKMKSCAEVGIIPVLHDLPAETPQKELETLINDLNQDPSISGIFLQLPLADHLDANHLINLIDPRKDVDGLTHINLGKIMAADDGGLAPCTPSGVMTILRSLPIDLAGRHAVIIGRSLLFGKPMGQLLLQADCTVTQCHSKTRDLPSITRQADILIAAIGQPRMITADHVKNCAIVIDVGITRMPDGTITGDVDTDNVQQKAAHITPVPGGVGPMTVAHLLDNTVRACE